MTPARPGDRSGAVLRKQEEDPAGPGRAICATGAQMAGDEQKHQPASTIRTGGGLTWP
jgi:hypothetical protein